MTQTFQNDLFLRAARGEQVERPPVWMMRQAGRILPEYRAVRERLSGFIELCTTPALAAEVTLQPVDILGVDAAIIFSDILVIPEAMGLPYLMEEKRGPQFPKTIQSKADIDALITGVDAASHLQYVYDAISIAKKEINGRVPLIGFSGAPWTILAYMVEGSGSKTFSKAKRFLYTNPELAHALLQKITDATIEYLKLQVNAGANLVQIFDSWAGILSPAQYQAFSLPYLKQISAALSVQVPVTLFAKDAWHAIGQFGETDCSVIGLDWTVTPEFATYMMAGKRTKVFQGNLDPCVLYATPEIVTEETKKMLNAFGRGHIANLGHGVYPDTPLEGVRAFIETVKAHRY